MNFDDVLLSVAVVAVVISLVGMSFTYYSIDSFKKTWLTGFATSTATVNLTVESTLAINFTTNNINFGSGQVDMGAQNATLETPYGNLRGNWTNVSQGFILENIGNVDCNLSIKTGKTAGTFIGGTTPLYQWNVTNNKTGSCVAKSAFTLAAWNDWNTTGTGTEVCDVFFANNSKDEIRIDIALRVPQDSKTGALGDIITATAS